MVYAVIDTDLAETERVFFLVMWPQEVKRHNCLEITVDGVFYQFCQRLLLLPVEKRSIWSQR